MLLCCYYAALTISWNNNNYIDTTRRLCDLHFEDGLFMLLNSRGGTLKRNAVPTLFKHSKPVQVPIETLIELILFITIYIYIYIYINMESILFMSIDYKIISGTLL